MFSYGVFIQTEKKKRDGLEYAEMTQVLRSFHFHSGWMKERDIKKYFFSFASGIVELLKKKYGFRKTILETTKLG